MPYLEIYVQPAAQLTDFLFQRQKQHTVTVKLGQSTALTTQPFQSLPTMCMYVFVFEQVCGDNYWNVGRGDSCADVSIDLSKCYIYICLRSAWAFRQLRALTAFKTTNNLRRLD